jgi:Golgi phosphoprotein 3 (GPP34)
MKVDGHHLVTPVGPLVIVVVMEGLGEDLVLLSIRPDKAKIGNPDKLDYGLMGSELVRLAALGRVNVAGERIVVLDAAPTGDPELDAALSSLTEARRPPKATAWVGKPRRGIRDAYLARLARAGVIRIEPAKFLGVPIKPLLRLTDSGRAAGARARLDAIALSSGPVDTTQAAYGGLAHATGLAGLLYRGRDGRPACQRLAEVAKGQQTATTAADAVDAAHRATTDGANRATTQAAVDAANAAAVHAAVHAANHAASHAAAHAGGGASGGHGH